MIRYCMREENPFENKDVAEQWIYSVEGEKGIIRDNETYPRLYEWFNSTSRGVVVDVGSGQGMCSTKIEGYTKYIGVEPSTFLTERAKELYSNEGREFVIGNAYEIPLDNESCDNAFSINVWFHLENIEAASRELCRVLRPKGKFFLHTADSEAFDLWQKFYKNSTMEGRKLTGEIEAPVNNKTRNIFYMHTNSEVVAALEHAGLTVSTINKLGKLDDNKELFIVIEGEKV